MTKAMRVHHKKSGFTLIETIIYIGLFSLIFTGIFVSIYPLMTGAERLSRNVAIEGETAFILAKIEYALSDSITSSSGTITSPAAGATGSSLVIAVGGNERYRFEGQSSSSYCTTPLICRVLTLKTGGGSNDAIPLNAQRVQVENFSVTHTGPTGGEPRYLDVSFTVNGEAVGPVRYYLHF
jgi:type II secretory pathway pseudopilin PulG